MLRPFFQSDTRTFDPTFILSPVTCGDMAKASIHLRGESGRRDGGDGGRLVIVRGVA